MRVSLRRVVLGCVAGAGFLAAAHACAPSIAAGALLHPFRRPVTVDPPPGCRAATFAGEAVRLSGWTCAATARHRGTIVFLHGVADNRSGAAGVASRFTRSGFDVVAYDSRAHGESEGEACTYGYYEKADLRRVLDTIANGPIGVIGTSLGAAVAIQAAADDPRIKAVVAAEVFSDLETVARQRAPFFLPDATIRQAFAVAGAQGHFPVERISPADAARRITVPVLLIHGAEDTDTPPAHSERVYANLAGPKQLIIVSGARHNHSLSNGAIWDDIDRWFVEWFGDPLSR